MFFNSLARSTYLSFFFFFCFLSTLLCGQLEKQNPQFSKSLFLLLLLLLIIIRSGRLAEIRWSVCISKSQRSLCVSFFRTDSGLCVYHSFLFSSFTFLHISYRITVPTKSCLVLYSFCANLLHSLIIWLMVSSLSRHNLHLLFCCVLSILTFIWLVLILLLLLLWKKPTFHVLTMGFLITQLWVQVTWPMSVDDNIYVVSKVGDRSRGRPEDSLFNSYYNEG